MNHDEGYGNEVFAVVEFFLAILWTTILLLQFGQGQISSTYFNLYLAFGIFAIIHGAIALVVNYTSADDSLLGRVVFLMESESDLRPFASLGLVWKISTYLLVALLLFILITSQGFSVYSIPNAYTWGAAVTPSTFSDHPTIQNLFLGAIIPGLFEEWIVFAGIQAMVSITLLVMSLFGWFEDVEENVAAYWIVTVIVTAVASLIYAYFFATAHSRYAGNAQALIYAGSFEFVMQMGNHLLGGFFSWIPHTFHNSAVVLTETLSIVLFALIAIPKKWLGWKHE